MKVLGIESSCDETAAAVVEDGRRALSDVVATQIEIHRRWGGVVPELASRNHVVQIMPVVDEALTRAGVKPEELDGIAVTSGPGLVGALLVGVQVAKALALAWNKPLVRVNHLEGHLVAAFLAEKEPVFPFLGLVVSGGHTSLYDAQRFGDYKVLGQTRDDAAGEAFDKGAKLLGLPYPGGIAIDKLAKEGDRKAVRFPKAIIKGAELDFSFSGLKTALLHHVKKFGVPEGKGLADLCASYRRRSWRRWCRSSSAPRASSSSSGWSSPAAWRPTADCDRRCRSAPPSTRGWRSSSPRPSSAPTTRP
jgi:N6-L-threonylcarbamoyladenine synthase